MYTHAYHCARCYWVHGSYAQVIFDPERGEDMCLAKIQRDDMMNSI